MFDITELDEMVCSQLKQSSLARCARVTKKWNKVIVPYIWRKISARNLHSGARALRRLVLEDYEREKHQLAQQQIAPPPAKMSLKAAQVNEPSESMEQAASLALTKYGHYVRQVECFTGLVLCMEQQRVIDRETSSTGYSAGDLVRHFLKRCPNALLHYNMIYEHVKSVPMFEVVMEALPRVSKLTISGSVDRRVPFPVTRLKEIFAATSNNLDSLTIYISRLKALKRSPANARASPVTTARPKHLKLCKLDTDGPIDLSWIWHACGQVEKLEVSQLSSDVMLSLISYMRHSMTSLDSVTFGDAFGGYGVSHVYEHHIRAILTASTKRLTAVHCAACAHMGHQAFDTLLQHTSTLKEFTVRMVLDGSNIMRVLKSCPQLRKLTALDNESYWETLIPEARIPEARATAFIDWDPELNAPRPWPCKTTLETLAIKITGFPQHYTPAPNEQQGGLCPFLDTQQRVCERLAEFTNLKFLRLGHTSKLCLSNANPRVRRGRHWHTVARQDMCLQLTLATGLGRLANLKKLEELHIPNMDHRVLEVAEVAWMVEHWPKLWKIIGLDPASRAYKWLKKNHPEIHLELPSSY